MLCKLINLSSSLGVFASVTVGRSVEVILFFERETENISNVNALFCKASVCVIESDQT